MYGQPGGLGVQNAASSAEILLAFVVPSVKSAVYVLPLVWVALTPRPMSHSASTAAVEAAFCTFQVRAVVVPALDVLGQVLRQLRGLGHVPAEVVGAHSDHLQRGQAEQADEHDDRGDHRLDDGEAAVAAALRPGRHSTCSWLKTAPDRARIPITIMKFFEPLLNRIVSCWPKADAVLPENVAAGAVPGEKRTQP